MSTEASTEVTSKNFSHQERTQGWNSLDQGEYDFLVIGGGITGAGVAWDAASRGYTVALVEKDDFAQGTSSRSSKLVHGGLRYLENYEFPLVFEALSERSYLMKAAPHLVRPLPFYMPVYEDSPHSSYLLSAGMWLYDVLSLFRAPGLHQKISAGASKRMIPGIKEEGLVCSFKYYDASMWDDALVIDVLVRAHQLGANVLSRVKAVKPVGNSSPEMPITQFEVRDELTGTTKTVRFKKLIVCTGVWTDFVGETLDPKNWKPWIAPSRGVHLVFDQKRFPLPGAVTMQIDDGRIAFAIPRPDYGQGITIVGTTDGPTSLGPDQVEQEKEAIEKDQTYLLELLAEYFPKLKLKPEDVLSHYIGIRPLVRPDRVTSEGDSSKAGLQKVSREHTIEAGPGGSTIVAGGKYTTFRKMAEEIVDFATQEEDVRDPNTDEILFPPARPAAVSRARELASLSKLSVPEKLFERYGADALEIVSIHDECCDSGVQDPEGFPMIEAQFRYSVRRQMVLSVEDFVRRRQPLHLCRQDHGAPWLSLLQKALEQELAR